MTVETIQYTSITIDASECDKLVRVLEIALGMSLQSQDVEFTEALVAKLKR
jgi:hypothetical protein